MYKNIQKLEKSLKLCEMVRKAGAVQKYANLAVYTDSTVDPKKYCNMSLSC